jgi:broad specificity phosphatase PhoE
MTPERPTLVSGPLKEAHETLRQTVEELRGWWHEVEQLGKPRFGEMGMRVQTLKSKVAAHFELEEAGGYLQEPLNAAPHLAEQAQRLLTDHKAVLAELDRLSHRLEASPCEFDCWTAAWHELAAILAKLEKHEHDENEFWQTAFENDLGSID